MRGFVRQSIHWSVNPSVPPSGKVEKLVCGAWGSENEKGNQPDKTQSQKIQKPCTYDFFPVARAALIGNH